MQLLWPLVCFHSRGTEAAVTDLKFAEARSGAAVLRGLLLIVRGGGGGPKQLRTSYEPGPTLEPVEGRGAGPAAGSAVPA